MSTSTDLVATGEITAAVREQFAAEQVNLIRATVARDANDAELAMFLELCARYRLDPFAGQIYCAKMRSENGEGGRVQIIVGRDGFLKIAADHEDFEGFDSDVVRENDTFKVTRKDGIPVVTHDYEGSDVVRGPIQGAWCVVHRRGYRPRYFYAPLVEYKPVNERKLRYSPWSAQESVMIEKCAITTCLRLAFNISGVVGEEEASRQLTDVPTAETEWPKDERMTDYLMALFEECNRIKPNSFRPKKQHMLLRGKDEDGYWQLAEELAEFIRKHDGKVPPMPDAEPDVIEAEAEVEEQEESEPT
jgi:phage recombination protein Bet